MIKSYERTLFRRTLEGRTVEIHTYENCKYHARSMENLGQETITSYTDVESWDIVTGGKEAEAIEQCCLTVDEYHEYLILHFSDGHTLTFRNSHTDMFVL